MASLTEPQNLALALQCVNPNQLLKFLMSNKEGGLGFKDKTHTLVKNRVDEPSQNNTVKTWTRNRETFCYNCREKGHTHASCTKPLIKCTKRMRFGHKLETCYYRTNNNQTKTDNVPKTMRILSSSCSSKY